jgi:hypothetical protein
MTHNGTAERIRSSFHCLAVWGYSFPDDDEGRPYLANLRGPDYMHFMRRRALAAGVTVLDHQTAPSPRSQLYRWVDECSR